MIIKKSYVHHLFHSEVFVIVMNIVSVAKGWHSTGLPSYEQWGRNGFVTNNKSELLKKC